MGGRSNIFEEVLPRHGYFASVLQATIYRWFLIQFTLLLVIPWPMCTRKIIRVVYDRVSDLLQISLLKKCFCELVT